MKELISNLRKKKPNFLRQNSNKYKFKNKWRAPRGLHNKIRLKRKGHVKQPSIGYGTPSEIKFLDKNTGLKPILVSNISELLGINSKTELVIVASRIGMKKKVEIIKKCQELKLSMFNVKDSENELKEIEKTISEKKKTKETKVVKEKVEKNTIDAKTGHKQSSVPGTKQ